jgi:DNA-binding PadR family transcriptional regulator
MQPIVEKEKITYLITSYLSKEDKHEAELIKDIHDHIVFM